MRLDGYPTVLSRVLFSLALHKPIIFHFFLLSFGVLCDFLMPSQEFSYSFVILCIFSPLQVLFFLAIFYSFLCFLTV
jgi:hypothetical protein